MQITIFRFLFLFFIPLAPTMLIAAPPLSHFEIQALELMQSSLGNKDPFTTEILSGGCSGSAVIKVSNSEKAYVVRFWNMQWVEDFPQDLACQLIASEIGYGPKVHFADANACITIMDYHDSEPLPPTQIRLQKLVNLLKKIQTGPQALKGIDRATYIDDLIEKTKHINFYDAEKIRSIKNNVFSATRPNANYVMCHRDLHHGNLIYSNGEFLAIDYTWGATDDPYVDLANIAIFNCESEEEENLLLQLYLGRVPNRNELARLALLKQTAKIFYGLECVGLASIRLSEEEIASLITSKRYMHIGQPKGVAYTPSDFLDFAHSLLSEVLAYSKSQQYIDDLADVSRN